MPVALPALADLSVLTFCVGCLIFCILCVLIVKALFGTASSAVSWIPWVGSAASSGLHKAEQHVVSIFSAGANKSQSYIGSTWHYGARLVDWLGREINSHANMLLLLANQIPGVGLVHSLLADVAFARREIARLWHSTPSIAHGIARPIEGELKALERWTYPRVKALDKAVDHTIPKDIAGLRARTKTLEGELSRAWDAIRHNELALAGTAFAGAVALALSRLDLGWLRCSNTRTVGKQLCGMNPSELEGLLGLLVGVIAIEDYQQLVKLMQGVEQVTAEGIQTLLKV